MLSCVDQPRPGERLQIGGMLSGRGWAISGSPIASIAVHVGEQCLGYASYGQPRPEIGREFGHYPQAHHSGFVFSLRIGPEIERAHGADLEFRFRTEDGSESRRHVALGWGAAQDGTADEEASRPWPIRLALEECRVDEAGRLRLRGWVVARGELTALQLFVNDTPLHTPERGLERPDIAQRHPAYPGAGLSGFRLVQALDAPVGARDTVRVVAHAGGIQRQIIVPLSGPDLARRVLQAGAVSLCCETLLLLPDGSLMLGGWSVGESETREIEVLGPEGTLGLAEIGLPRPDIGNRFPQLPGARFAGFRFRAANSLAVRDPITLVVRDAITLVVRDAQGERRLALQLPGAGGADAGAEVIHAGIDTPALLGGRADPIRGVVTIAGWAVCASGIEFVEVWSDETLLGRAYVGVRREDIGATYPDLPESLTAGFALTVPHRRIGDGEHAIRVLIQARSGLTTEEVFRVVLETEDDSRLGAPRRSVPASETALRCALLERFGPMPSFTVLVRRAGGGELRGLVATLDSLRRQTVTDWRALVLLSDGDSIAGARAVIAGDPMLAARVHAGPAADLRSLWNAPAAGSWPLVCMIQAGDRLGADALIELALEARLSGAAFVYADERCFDPTRESVRPFLKPGWAPELLLSMNYIGRSWCATAALVRRALPGLKAIERLGDYDIVLRLTEEAETVAHVPLSLGERAGRRLEPAAREQEALQRAAVRRGITGTVLPGRAPGGWRLRRALETRPLVSVVIATCGARGLIRTAIESLRTHTAYAPIEIVVLDDMPADQAALKLWVGQHADRVIPVAGPFNWSRVNNFGARAARGALLLFLNDDTECRDPGWLEALVEQAQRPEVGAVGPQLLYPDGKVQHAGMFLRGADGLHAFRFADGDDPGTFGLALTQREVTAVTGACLLVRREVFEALGGFDESHGVIKNDLDFCLRVTRAGLRCVFTPYASLVHHEMASRAALADSFDAGGFDRTWGIRQLQGDPWVNPNLARDSEDFLAETEPVQLLQPRLPLIDRARVRRILVVKLDHIGDFICALPAIERLRAAFADARITLLGASASLALASLSPAIDDVVQFDFFSAKSIAGRRHISEAEFDALAAQLRPMHFDLAVDLRMHGDTRHVLRSTGAALLAGFDHGGRFPWLDIVVEWEGDLRLLDKRTHVADSLRRLAAAIDDAATPPAPSLRLADDTNTLPRLLDGAGAPAGFRRRPLVCIHPGAGTPLKQWPAAHYAGLIGLLLEAHELAIVLIGTGDEVGVASTVAALVDRPDAVLSLAGRVHLAELPAVLASCVLFVGNDSGPKHLAGALGVPTVGVHASHVDAAEWAPPGPRAIAVRRHMTCGPCYIAEETDCPRGVACLRGIEPAQVYRACRLLLGFTFPPGATARAGSGGAPAAIIASEASNRTASMRAGGSA